MKRFLTLTNFLRKEGSTLNPDFSTSEFVLLRLGDLIEHDKNKVSKLLSAFNCGYSDMDRFIRYNAIEYHEKDINRTYLLFRKNTLIAYFSIAVTSISFTEESGLDENTRAKYNISFDRPKGAYLIGHIAKMKGAKTGMIDVVLPIVKSLIKNVQDIVGGNIICLDCNIKKLQERYVEHGFEILGTSPEFVGKNYKRMFYVMTR